MGVHAGQIGRAAGPGGGIDLLDGGRAALGPAGFVPAVADDRSGMGGGVLAHQLQASRERIRLGQVQTRQLQAERGDVHVRIDEGRGDESAVQIDDFGVGVQSAAGAFGPQPDHGAVGDRHRGGIGGTGTVDSAADQQLGTHG